MSDSTEESRMDPTRPLEVDAPPSPTPDPDAVAAPAGTTWATPPQDTPQDVPAPAEPATTPVGSAAPAGTVATAPVTRANRGPNTGAIVLGVLCLVAGRAGDRPGDQRLPGRLDGVRARRDRRRRGAGPPPGGPRPGPPAALRRRRVPQRPGATAPGRRRRQEVSWSGSSDRATSTARQPGVSGRAPASAGSTHRASAVVPPTSWTTGSVGAGQVAR